MSESPRPQRKVTEWRLDREFLAALASLQASPIELPPPGRLKREIEEAYCPGEEFCGDPEFHAAT